MGDYFALIVRLVAYALMVPSAVVLAVSEYNQRNPVLSALMALYGLLHLVQLVIVVLDLYGIPRPLIDDVRSLLTPVVVAQCGLYIWLVGRWLQERRIR